MAFPFAVVKKFSDDQAGNQAALIAYFAFFSLFPLLLLAFTVLGYVAAGNPSLQHHIHHALVSQFPVFGEQLPVGSLHGSVLGLVVGGGLALWSGLAVGKSAQNAFDSVYGVPRDDRPGLPWSLLRALRVLATGGLGFIVTTSVGGLVTDASAFGVDWGIGLRVLGALVATALNIALFTVLFRWLVSIDVGWREVLPGAIVAGVTWTVLEHVGTALLSHQVAGAQSTYGTFATVIGILWWFHMQAQITLLCAEVNVVRKDRLWPRSISDPPSTPADRKVVDLVEASASP